VDAVGGCSGCMQWVHAVGACSGCMQWVHAVGAWSGCMDWVHGLDVWTRCIEWVYGGWVGGDGGGGGGDGGAADGKRGWPAPSAGQHECVVVLETVFGGLSCAPPLPIVQDRIARASECGFPVCFSIRGPSMAAIPLITPLYLPSPHTWT
jgi:hypothetical protein